MSIHLSTATHTHTDDKTHPKTRKDSHAHSLTHTCARCQQREVGAGVGPFKNYTRTYPYNDAHAIASTSHVLEEDRVLRPALALVSVCPLLHRGRNRCGSEEAKADLLRSTGR